MFQALTFAAPIQLFIHRQAGLSTASSVDRPISQCESAAMRESLFKVVFANEFQQHRRNFSLRANNKVFNLKSNKSFHASVFPLLRCKFFIRVWKIKMKIVENETARALMDAKVGHSSEFLSDWLELARVDKRITNRLRFSLRTFTIILMTLIGNNRIA